MALKSLCYLMIFALLGFSSLSGVSAVFGGRKTLATAPAPPPDSDEAVLDNGGSPISVDLGFTPMDTKTAMVSDLAKYAVSEYNKANNGNLVLSHVLEATSTVDGQGTKYGLVILASNGEDLDSYFINISDVKGVKNVTSFSRGQ